MKNILLCLLLFLSFSCAVNKPSGKYSTPLKYQYELNLNDYKDDKISVRLSLNGLNEETATFCFPKIVPGIYGAMDFGQYIHSITVKDRKGRKLETKKIDSNCWEIKHVKQVATIEYEVDDSWEEFDLNLERGFYRSAASTFKEDVFVINPNCVFGYFREFDDVPVELVVNKPENFYGATSLKKVGFTTKQDKYEVSDYHQLVDNPILYALPDTTTIQLPNVSVEVACYSTTDKAISEEIAKYIKPLLINQNEYLGGKLPVDKYSFILYHNLSPDQYSYLGDGLEHSHSTLILFCMPMDMETIKENVYGIASHEFFHTLMPLGIHSHEIANYDFNNPKFSRHLWLYEGMTEYFTIHMPIKNGVQNLPEFIEVLDRKISEMNTFDNTLSFTELSLNPMDMQDQYYNVYLKGALINLCLDIQLRELSDGKYGVQNLVMDLIDRYGANKSFDDEKLFDEIVDITGFPELKDFFNKYVVGHENLPLNEVLQKVGLQLENEHIVELDKLSKDQQVLRKHWINQ